MKGDRNKMTPAIENPTSKTSFLKGFLNFDEFITAPLVKIVYIVGLVLIPLVTIGGGLVVALGGLTVMFGMMQYLTFANVVTQLFAILVQLIVSILACVLGILLLRLYCEFILVIFKINENLQALRNRNAQI
jgi:hypothetical protein